MEKIKLLVISGIIAFFTVSCAKDIVDISGEIKGVVKDYNEGFLISNCAVTLMPSGKSFITSEDGLFSFPDLEAGSYTLSFSKSGYESQTKVITVVSGQIADASVILKSKSPFAISENELDFGDLASSKVITLSNNTDVTTTFEMSNVPSWMTISTRTGSVAAGSVFAVTITVNRDYLDYGTISQNISISYKGKNAGVENLAISVSKVKLTTPTVQIATSATNIDQKKFDIEGAITATGGSAITSYGHCWSTLENPTVNDSKTNFGSVSDIVPSFKSSITGLTLATTYYVRAYATNEKGTSYSSQIKVETKDVASRVWDGNIASSFAGGNGTYANPYQIETGGQLLLMKNYSDKSFILKNNIDLDYHNWLPFEFSGNLNGNGYTISHLYIERTNDNVGLFSKLATGAVIENLNIKNPRIYCSDCDAVGVLFGTVDEYGSQVSLKNISIFLNDEYSQIQGNNYVGGIYGGCESTRIVVKMDNCKVVSSLNYVRITGNNYVGGIIGYLAGGTTKSANISLCSAEVNIRANEYVGGITGAMGWTCNLNKCSFVGTIYASTKVGGICGYMSYNCSVTASKADAIITCNGVVGGIAGSCESRAITACYTKGSIQGNETYAIAKEGGTLCYSTMQSPITGLDCATTYSKASGSNTIANCTNIKEYLQEAYSEYASYYNFNKTWTWTGVINGNTVSVPCPQLAWE